MAKHYLGIDAGSSFTKFVVIDESKNWLFQSFVKTMTRNKNEELKLMEKIGNDFSIERICSTGYGRQHYKNADVIKTELYCASEGVTGLFPTDKTIIDIGGEDVKIIKSSANGKVMDFYMNTRCAAGTGAFITEIAERAEIDLSKISELAAKSSFNRELNSFCTVFAKTEVMQWIFDDVPIEDIAKGIYISVANRIKKIPIDRTLPVYLIGGVAEYHPFMKNVLAESLGIDVTVPEKPQYINAYGASLYASDSN
jgi:predicted CoA-substrate-specific enzyme activase